MLPPTACASIAKSNAPLFDGLRNSDAVTRKLLTLTKSCLRCQKEKADETGLCVYCYLDIKLAAEAASNFSSDPYVIPDDFNMAHIHPSNPSVPSSMPLLDEKPPRCSRFFN